MMKKLLACAAIVAVGSARPLMQVPAPAVAGGAPAFDVVSIKRNPEPRWTPESPGGGIPVDGVSIFTALQEQLGVKLEPSRGPVDVLVIDSVAVPSEN